MIEQKMLDKLHAWLLNQLTTNVRIGALKSSHPPKRPNIMNIMVSLVQDVLQSAADAAKDSVAQNIQENLPALSSVLG